MKNLIVEVAEVKERCGAFLKPGDAFEISGYGRIVIPDNHATCMYALPAENMLATSFPLTKSFGITLLSSCQSLR